MNDARINESASASISSENVPANEEVGIGGYILAACIWGATYLVAQDFPSVGAILAGAATGILCLPFCVKLGVKYLAIKTARDIQKVSVLLLCIATIWLFVSYSEQLKIEAARIQQERAEQAKVEERERVRAEAERQAALKREAAEFYLTNKRSELARITALVRAGNFAQAKIDADKYDVEDQDLARLKGTIELAALKEEAKRDSMLSAEQRLTLYRRLAELEPRVTSHAANASKAEAQLTQEKAREAQERQRLANLAARRGAVEAQFSGWDGSHRAVERAIKERMKNPDSYKHVETRFIDNGSIITIFTTFRGTNSFGAVVPNTAVAEVDINGRVLTLNIR